MKIEKKRKKQWTVLTVAVLLIGGVVGSYFLLNTRSEPDSNVINQNNVISNVNINKQGDISISEEPVTQGYENTEYGFLIEFPVDWQLDASYSGQGDNRIFSINMFNQQESIGLSVMPLANEGLLRNSISIEQESEVEIGVMTATKLVGGSLKDGSLVNIIILKKGDHLFSLRGIGSNFDQIASSFLFI